MHKASVGSEKTPGTSLLTADWTIIDFINKMRTNGHRPNKYVIREYIHINMKI